MVLLLCYEITLYMYTLILHISILRVYIQSYNVDVPLRHIYDINNMYQLELHILLVLVALYSTCETTVC